MDTQNLTGEAKAKKLAEEKAKLEAQKKLEDEAKAKKLAEEKAKTKDSNKLEIADQKLLDKDDEIAKLKAKLADARKVNITKKDDIKGRVNVKGDMARVKIGVGSDGNPIFKKAIDLTEADIKRREAYKKTIKQLNSKQ